MTDSKISIDSKTTALVLIDLQKGITGRTLAPHQSEEVVANAAKLVERIRELGSPVVLVRVSFAADNSDRIAQPVDSPIQSAGNPPGWDTLVPEIGPHPGDIVVTKRQWGAFYGTDLDLQLRRRGIRTIVLGGIATNFGVESTARDAYERNYALIFAEDAMSDFSAEAHTFAIANIFPRIGRVRSTAAVLTAIRSPYSA